MEDESFLEQSEQSRKRRAVPWRAWAALAACLCLIAVGVRALWRSPTDTGGEGCAVCPPEFPGGIEPVLRVNGRLYQWSGLNHSGMLEADEDGVVYGHTYLPEGFVAAGEISGVTEEIPTEDLQIQAGVPFRGTVYVDPEAPLVVYARVNTDWIRDCYARFVNEDYKTGTIRVAGELYYWGDAWGDHGRLDRLEDLPQEAVYVGTIQAVVEDRYPVHDLEANNDNFYSHMVGREIFQDPADASVIYVQDESHWREGTDYFWWVCPRWDYDAD